MVKVITKSEGLNVSGLSDEELQAAAEDMLGRMESELRKLMAEDAAFAKLVREREGVQLEGPGA